MIQKRLFLMLLSVHAGFCFSGRLQAQTVLDFESTVRPLLIRHCADCHGPELQKSGLRLDARHAAFRGGDGGPVIVPGKSSESELLRRITTDNPDERMPPESDPLPPGEVSMIRQWIDSGAEWPETEYDRDAAIDRRLQHWSFQPLRPVQIPEVPGADSSAPTTLNPIDKFVLAKLFAQGLSHNPEADRRTLIRRATLDLTGLPPEPERVDQFVSEQSPDAWNILIEELLASPRYGERWAQHWLDVVRYADTHGFEVNTPRDNAWHYRDYVIRALNNHIPYDQFVREQIAGDVFNADEATGFLVASAVLLPGQIGADEESKRLARQDALDEIIVGTTGTVLGLTIGCARCHDHKFDPVTAKDYYSLQAFFAGVEYSDRPIRNEGFHEQQKRAAELGRQATAIEAQLGKFEPIAAAGRTLLLDEENKSVVSWLKKENGPGTNPAGTKPGYRDEVGAAGRTSNLSGGRYIWWNNVPGEDVMTYNPGVAGRFHVWLSWGAHGSGVHTRDARYLLDQDGNLQTRDDQRELARVDQYFLAGVAEGQTEQVPLWSGLLSVGVVELQKESRIILRGGDTGTGITADVVLLQEVAAEDAVNSEGTPIAGQPSLRAPVSPIRNVEVFSAVPAKYVRFTVEATINENQHEPCLDELEVYSPDHPEQNLALATVGTKATSSGNISETGIHQLKHINDGLYGNSHSWISSERGGGWVQLELPQLTPVNRIVWGRDREGKFPDRLPVRYQISVSTDGEHWTVVAHHQDRVPMGMPFDPVQSLLAKAALDSGAGTELTAMLATLQSLQEEKKRLETPVMAFAGAFRDPDKTYLLRRGDPEQRMEETTPAIPAVFTLTSGADVTAVVSEATQPVDVVEPPSEALTPEQRRRVTLANWLASSENPLTARVIVNRLWLGHFGRGLVDTPSDFGINGTPPSHPELLDWLAGELIRSGWSLKHVHRLILQSATYRQSGEMNSRSAELDKDNTLLWRYGSRRMESEAVRDCMLTVSGELNLKMGGPGFSFFKTRGGLDGFPPRDEFTAEEMRRMIYSHKVRMEQVPVFGAFDCPDAGQSAPRRGRSTTAIQALNLFNSPFVNERAVKFAERIAARYPTHPEQQIQAAFQIALGRQPSAEELTRASAVASLHGMSTVCRAILNSSEFLFIP